MVENTEVKIAKFGVVQAVTVALISAVAAIATAYVQIERIKPATTSEVLTIFDQKIPIGTVVPSMLPPKMFSSLAGDPGGFDPTQSSWVPADGRDVPGSLYSKKVSTAVPDFRGMFIRGLNYTENGRMRKDGREDPDGAHRTIGQYQEDQFARHAHKLGYKPHGLKNGDTHSDLEKGEPGVSTEPEGESVETRPKNIAIIYYIKIN